MPEENLAITNVLMKKSKHAKEGMVIIESIHRPTRLLIHSQAIVENIQNELKNLPEKVEVFATVKANAYGHGMIGVAKIAKEAGVTGFCVATLDEGIALREAGVSETILILGVVSPEYAPLLARYKLSVTVATREWVQQVSSQFPAGTFSRPILIHLKADTGMGRLGFRTTEEIREVLERVNKNSSLKVEGFLSHFATADEKNSKMWGIQHAKFQEFLRVFSTHPRYVHCANTATAFWHKEFTGNLVRLGIGMYGLNPSSGKISFKDYFLKPALALESELVQVKQINAGEGISYSQTWVASEPTWIGTVPIGYADGWVRKMQGFSVLVAGTYCEIVGHVCMDQLMIRLPGEKKIGEKVTLIGKNGGHEITMQEVADYLGTIHYEVACLFGERIPRIFVED